jgi:MFS family permease
MPNPDEDTHSLHERNAAMKNSIADGIGYSAMVGVGDTYIPAAAIALGATNFQIGLLAALPQLFGAISQFFSINILRFYGSRKKMVVSGSLLHSICWILIAAVVFWPGPLSVPLMILFFSIGVGLTMLSNPAWSSWISDIVPDNERPGFFATRNSLMQVSLFIATFGAGIAIRQLELQYAAAFAFAVVFIAAFLSRLAATYFHNRLYDVKYELQLIREIKLKHLFLLPAYRNELWFLVFMALVSATTQFASPFFMPYMLNSLHFDIGLVGIISATTIIVKIVAFPYWGKAADRLGNRAVLVASSFMTPFVPLLWLTSTDQVWIMIFSAFSGFVWAGFDLASFNYALALVGRELRPSFISKYNAFNGFFYAAGAISGGLFLVYFPNAMLFGFSGIMLIFLLSGISRLLAVLAFAPKLSHGTNIENKMGDRAMIIQLFAVAPTQGAINGVLGGWNFTRKVVEKGAMDGGIAMTQKLRTTKTILIEEGRKLASKVSRKRRL